MMARGKKKESALTPEEKLAQALVPVEEQPYRVPKNWCWVYLFKGAAECMDSFRKPINATERAEREGDIPYYGATGQVGWIDDFLTDEELVLLGEDGAPFLDPIKDKAYLINGRAWVNNHAHILRSYFGSVGNQYLVNYLNTFNYKGYVNGTTRLKLTQASMDIMPVPIPPLAEQQRIVDRIEYLFAKLDEAKEKAQSVLDSFETRKAAILHKAFTGELTAKWRAEHGVGLEGWKTARFHDICAKITDGTHHSPPNTDSGDYMYVTAKNIKEYGVDLSNITYVSKEVHEEIFARCDVRPGDVLYIKDGATTGIATVNTITEPFSLLSSVAVLRPIPRIVDPYYMAYHLNSSETKAMMINNMSGNAITRLTLAKIKNAQITVCSIDEQQEIVHILDSLFAKEQQANEAAEAVLEQIDLLKKSILARAFRGELGTNDPAEESALSLLRAIL